MDSELKHEVHNKDKNSNKRPKTEPNFSASFQDDSTDKMMIIGRGFHLSRSRALSSGYNVHECHSDTSVNPFNDGTQHKDSCPTEGLQAGLSEHPSASSISFTSAVSDFSPSEIIHKKLLEMESEIVEKDATISFLKKELSTKDKNTEYNDKAVETDFRFSGSGEYESELIDLRCKIEKREKAIAGLSKELEENIKAKGKLLDENRNLTHEINLLNRQLQSMYELVESKHWDTGIDPKEFALYRDKALELEDTLFKKDELITSLQETLKHTETNLESKDQLLTDTSRKYLEYKSLNDSEVIKLNDKITSLQNDAKTQEKIYMDKIFQAQKKFEDEIVTVTKKLEIQYEEDLKSGMERCRSCFKKLCELPKTRIESLLKLCETGKLDIMVMQNDWEEQKMSFEKKISALQEENKMEINRLIEGYESKISSLKSQLESLNQQLKERKETLQTFENELKLYRSKKFKQEDIYKASDFNELKKLHAAEILSQQEKHKLETDLLHNKVKRLSEEILSHTENEKLHCQELENAELMASAFREKYEQLLSQLEEKVNAQRASDHSSIINELDLEDTISHFKSLIQSLQKTEELHEGKIKLMKHLDQEEMLIHQKEMNLFKLKLEQVNRFQVRLIELDDDIKQLINTLEVKYMNAVQCVTKCHYSEIRLKELEMDTQDQDYSKNIMELKTKIRTLEEANNTLRNELHTSKTKYEQEMQSLKNKAEEFAVESLRNEGMLAVKTEIEDTLTQRIDQLESLIAIKNDSNHKELENALSKCIATEALLSAKEEIAAEYECRIKESERILMSANDLVDSIECQCKTIEKSFQRLEEIFQVIFDVNNCERYLVLKKKMDQLAFEFNLMYGEFKNIENDCDKLSKENTHLNTEKEEMLGKYRKMESEKNEIFDNYRLIENEMEKVMERSQNFENELNKILKQNASSEEKCNDIIRKNIHCYKESNSVKEGYDSNLLNKIESIGDKLDRTLMKIKIKKEEMSCATNEMQKIVDNLEGEKRELMEREIALREENSVMADNNIKCTENIKFLIEKVDDFLIELAAFRARENSSLCQDTNLSHINGDEINCNSSAPFSSQANGCIPSKTTQGEAQSGLGDYETENKNMELETKLQFQNGEEKRFFREEIVSKLDRIEKVIAEVMNEKSNLIQSCENLVQERIKLKKELEGKKKMYIKLQSDMVSDQPCASLIQELSSKEVKINKMRKEMKEMCDYVEVLKNELDLTKINNESLKTESRHHIRNNQCLKDELEEAWSQRYEIEDQLKKLRRENAVLYMHRDQLEQTNRRISNLISEGSPSVVSWIKIHETVENIVDVVQTLKTSFTDVNLEPSNPLSMDSLNMRPDLKSKLNPEVLHLELENKTKLCEELEAQKLKLEEELNCLENLMNQNDNIQFHEERGSKISLIEQGRPFLNSPDVQSNPNWNQAAQIIQNQNFIFTQEGIDVLTSNEEPCMETLHKLKKHFENQMHLQETQLTEALANEIEGIKREISGSEETVSKTRESVEALNLVYKSIEEIKLKHKEEITEINREHEIELGKLRDILKEIIDTGNNSLLIHEIESKHSKQMEELRLYFEKKCEELEKNFSLEIFSQHNQTVSNVGDDGISDLPQENKYDSPEDEICPRVEVTLEKYRTLLDEEESDGEQKQKFLKYLTEIVNRHAEEMNEIKVKHLKKITNIHQAYTSELNQMREELSQVKMSNELERETMIKYHENQLKEIAMNERKVIAAELEREFENKVKLELKNFSDLLQAESKAQEEHVIRNEELCVDKLSEYETESALKKVEVERLLSRKISKKNEENFQRELEREKIKIAQHYKELNENALKRFNEEQQNLIKSHTEIIHSLIKEYDSKILHLKRLHEQEVERFRSDKENKLAIEFQNREKKYENELSTMKTTYEGELYELKKHCQNILNEQVSLAKADAFNILQKQIQSYLDGEEEESQVSKEVVELGEKFAGKYRKEIEDLKEQHAGEVARIIMEYEEKIKRRYSTGSLAKKTPEKMELRTDDDKLQILRERDSLQEMVSSLRHVLSELIRYVGSCEEELNNTIVGEFGKSDETLYKSFVTDKSELNDSVSTILSMKVHFAPDLSSIITDINDSGALNTSTQVRMELDRCLKQLKKDASHLLALSNPAKKQDENIHELLLKIEKEKNCIAEKLIAAEEMQKTLRREITDTKDKLMEWERNRETVSEGYGEGVLNAQKQETMIQLKEKAKELMGQHCSQPTDILNVIEEICKEGDRLQEEARREKNDLQQQVAAADKQLRSMRKFLDEQAADREVERDDYINEIKRLKDAVKVRERDKSLQDRMSHEKIKLVAKRRHLNVEVLENQLKEANGRISEFADSKADLENQLKEAIDKVWSLREIIRELEGQVSTLSERESIMKVKVEELEHNNEKQCRINRDLECELDTLRSQTQNEYIEHMKHLEEELTVLRRASERLSPEAVSQMCLGLRGIELALAKKCKDLEQLHISSANVSCSSPSEDISVCERLDATRCPTPDEMQNFGEVQKLGLPLEEIDRINDKLMRHTRAEEVAIKTVRDLEMQLKNSRKIMDEMQIERDVLLERADKYLQENSRLKVRLDEQRCNAGLIQKQLSANLEAQIKRLEIDIEKLNDLCIQKDKQIRDMNIILEQTTKSLKIREAEVLNRSHEENELITNLKKELHVTLDEKKKLEETVGKMKETIRDTVTVPLLIDSMLEEKNAEIDRLEKELMKLSKEKGISTPMRAQSSVDSGHSSKSLKRVKFSEPDSFVQLVSPILPYEQSIARCGFDSYGDLRISPHRFYKSNNRMTTPESLSSIGPLQLSPRGMDSQLQWNNNSLISPTARENITKEDLNSLRNELTGEQIMNYQSEPSERSGVNTETKELEVPPKSISDVLEDNSLFKGEYENMLERESKLLSDIESKKHEISEHLLEIDTLKRQLAEVNLALETSKSEYQKLQNDLLNKDEDIRKLNSESESLLMTIETLKSNHLEEVDELQNKLNFEHDRVESVLHELKILEVKKVEIEEEFLSLKEDYDEKLTSEQTLISDLREEIKEYHRRNLDMNENYKKLEQQMEQTLKEANSLSKDLAQELNTMKEENEKLKSDYLTLKKEWDNCMTQLMDTKDMAVQVGSEGCEEGCQTNNDADTTLVPLRKSEINEELNHFQTNIERLKAEICALEQKMDERELQRDEILSYMALVRTLISCVIDNLDDHFYELQTYRMKIMECSVDDLTNRVQKELLLSAKLDSKLLSNFHTDGFTQNEGGSLINSVEEKSTIVENGGGDNNLSVPKQKQNLVNLTVKLYELETNLQEMEQRNKDFELQIATIRNGKEEERKRADDLQTVVKFLENCLSKERAKLAAEKSRCEEDAKIMEILRVNFEVSMDKIDELERLLSNERQLRMTLEKQVTILQNPENADLVAPLDLKCQLEVERQKCMSLGVSIEKEKQKYQELKLQLEQLRLERMSEKDVHRLMTKDFALLQEQKDQLESQLAYARDLIQTRQDEISTLRRKINLQEVDIKALMITNETQQEKEAEISVMAEKITLLEKEVNNYREQMQMLDEKSQSVSAPLIMKMKVLNNCVQQHVQESNEMGEALLHLTQETEQMRTIIKKIEESTEKGEILRCDSADETLIPDDIERPLWSPEKEDLASELEKVRCDYQILKMDSMEIFKSNDTLKLEIKKLNREIEALKVEIENKKGEHRDVGIPEDRVLHIFGKYMRTESYRKALAFQKLYLTRVLKGYETAEEEVLMRVLRYGSKKKELKRRIHFRSKKKLFKTVTLVVIAIKRMQFMVTRWRLIRLTGFNALVGRNDANNANKENDYRRHCFSSLYSGPIDPLKYQTHNIVREQRGRSHMGINVLRTPPSRDPDSRITPALDAKKIKKNFEQFNYHQNNVELLSRPP